MTDKQQAINNASVVIADLLAQFCHFDRVRALAIASAIVETDESQWTKSGFYPKSSPMQVGGE